MDEEHQVPIWFFIGCVLAIYGVLIVGAGIYGCFHPPEGIILNHLHADLWWGALMVIVGVFYLVKYCPCKNRKP